MLESCGGTCECLACQLRIVGLRQASDMKEMMAEESKVTILSRVILFLGCTGLFYVHISGIYFSYSEGKTNVGVVVGLKVNFWR